jgi:formylglycine-generating enzyme required for sulfatase activity
MSGNVAEWCADGYAGNYYARSPSDDPTGPEGAGTRVIRGGSWNDPASACRPAARSFAKPDQRSAKVGFRIVMVLDAAADHRRR